MLSLKLFQIDPSGCLLLIGYDDGVIRLFTIESESASASDAAGGLVGLYSVTKALSARLGIIGCS